MNERDMMQSGEEQEKGSLESSDKTEGERTLEEATHEPGARVEESGNIQEAEAIEANLVQMLDTQSPAYVEGQLLSAEDFEEEQEYQQEKGGQSGIRSFGSETSDPQKHYSEVEMKQGEILQDEDWNEREEEKGGREKEEEPKEFAEEEAERSSFDLQIRTNKKERDPREGGGVKKDPDAAKNIIKNIK